MFIQRIISHENLQKLAESISDRFSVTDVYTLRCAVVEVLQNTVQHSDGRFLIEFFHNRVRIVNLIRKSRYEGSGLGLQMFSGIYTRRSRRLFYTEIFPHKVGINSLDIEKIVG